MGYTKKRKEAGQSRRVLARNLKALMEDRYPDEPNKPKWLAERAKISMSSVQRIFSAETGATVDTLDSVAHALDVPPFSLLLDSDELVDTSGMSSDVQAIATLHEELPPLFRRLMMEKFSQIKEQWDGTPRALRRVLEDRFASDKEEAMYDDIRRDYEALTGRSGLRLVGDAARPDENGGRRTSLGTPIRGGRRRYDKTG
jgi:transcriptional regulator with XRE-family HTH domain